ncbi:MAG: DUF4124 domain-containing protein [Betaproteobacteria bacterium]
MKLRILLTALAIAFGTEAGAQMFKCQDAAGKITYSSQPCAEIGLKSAGEVQEKVNVAPAYKPPPAPKPPPTQARPPAKPAAGPAAAEPEKKKEPERRCFVVKTPTGTATRCNDVPEEKEKK